MDTSHNDPAFVPRSSSLSATMEAVAREAKVSRATVSRVLHNSAPVSPEVRTAVEEAVARLGYVPNSLAQSLAGRASGVIGLLLRNPSNPAYGLLHAELQANISRTRLSLVTVVPAASEREEHELAALERLVRLRVSGLVVATGVLPLDMLQPFVDVVPLVVVGRPVDDERVYSISYDERDNARTLANAVANYGHRSVAVVTPTREVSVPENTRGTVITEVLRERGVEVVELPAPEFANPSQQCDTIIRLVRDGRVTAAMFPSDTRMLWFITAARQAGLRVPEDVSVTGCDGTLAGSEILGLTTLRIPVEKAAERTVAVMEYLLAGVGPTTGHEELTGRFIPGTTLAPYTAAAPDVRRHRP